MTFDLIVADPPWPETGGGGRGAQNHYGVVDYRDIPRVVLSAPVWRPSPTFWFGVWTTVNSLPHGLDLLKACGTSYVTSWYWRKLNAKGEPHIGMGQYGRHGEIEQLLLGKRGRIGRLPSASKVRATTSAPIGPHSAKPDEIFEKLTLVFPGPHRLEMFARGTRPGFETWGDESPEENP